MTALRAVKRTRVSIHNAYTAKRYSLVAAN
jgi:hypothetical protein